LRRSNSGAQRTSIEERFERYRQLVGYVPEGIRARVELLSRLDPEYLETIEATRASNVNARHLDRVVVQFLMLAILLVNRDEEALAHASAALRMGATPDQLLDVVRIAGWLGGAQSFNLGFRVLDKLLKEQQPARKPKIGSRERRK
jgi:alkylhydroperoxidase/carboxymuconolactone decarboxylase family protein YurZ